MELLALLTILAAGFATNPSAQIVVTGTFVVNGPSFEYPAGTTTSFQLWYRTSTGSDFSDAVEVLVP